MKRTRLIFFGILVLAVLAGLLDYPGYYNKAADWLGDKGVAVPHFWQLPFHLGLDLQGGTHLVYEADLSQIEKKNVGDAMEGVRDVIERRVNLFGVAEPVVQVAEKNRLVVELAGVKDIKQAIEMIGETPALDFREQRPQEETDAILKAQEEGDEEALAKDAYFVYTGLSGKHLARAQLTFDPNTNKPMVSLEFNDEGRRLFAEITERNVGKLVAIYLDGMPISIPSVREPIRDGSAVISGDFNIEEARQLARRLNAGALPVPINLISQQSVEASLGKISLAQSLKAGLIGLLIVALFMILVYRLPGLLAVIALAIYTAIILALFKLIPVTLTLAGVAGFILSIGMAVDANILIFERLKEELRSGKGLAGAVEEGFKRAWTSIRDGNISTLITCIVLYFTAGMIKGFGLTLGIGILISMFSAILVTRTFLRLLATTRARNWSWLFGVRHG